MKTGAAQFGSLSAIAAAAPIDGPVTRVQLFPGFGTWKGRNGLGPYTLEDRDHAERVVAATMAAMGPVDLHFDYDHTLALAPAVAGISKAAGWFKSVKASHDGIWAEDVEWTPAAAAALEAREYRYASPYFLHDKQGRILSIVNAALTNYPNFNLAAVASAGVVLPGELLNMNELAQIVAALGLPAETTLAQVLEHLAAMKGATVALASATGALGLTAGADGAAIASAIGALKTGNPDPTKFVPIDQVTLLNSRLVVIEGERAEQAVAAAISSGKLAPSLKQWGLDLFKKDEAGFAAFASGAPAILQPGELDRGKLPDPKSDTLDASEKAIASAMGIGEAEFLASRQEMAA